MPLKSSACFAIVLSSPEPRDAGLLCRETRGEVLLVHRLRAALEKLNPALPPEAITTNIQKPPPETCDLLLSRLLSGQVKLKAETA